MVTRTGTGLVLLAATLLPGGCGESTVVPNTLRVVVSTDAEVPGTLDNIDLTGARGGSTRFVNHYDASDLETLPNSLLLHNEQPFDDQGNEILTPIEIRADGRLGSDVVITRRATLTFTTDRPVVLYLPLCTACAHHADCPDGTCVLGECADAYVDIATLLEDDGSQPAESEECPRGAR